ncbi:MAG: hypothetical protein LUD27_01010, partial [Clostridia bacterium]|nr:hypothetical protein [Clostridia bacterium]
SMAKDIKRNRKNENLAGLYAVSHDYAYKNGKLRKGVIGAVDKDTPFVSKPADKKNGKPRKFVKDMTSLPQACKNRILAYYDDTNSKGGRCYLAEKSVYDEMVADKARKSANNQKAKTKKD